MMSIVLSSVLLLAPPSSPRVSTLDVFSIGSITGATELAELREAVLEDKLSLAVRRASLDRYTELLTSGDAMAKAEQIASNIQEFVEPPADAEFSVEVLSASELQVTGSTEQLIWASTFIEAASDEGFLDSMVDVSITVYRLPAGSSEDLIQGSSGLTLTPESLKALAGKLETLKGADRMTTPRVLMNVGAPASISTVDQTAYIKDFELTFFPDLEKAIADPVVDVINEGLFIDLRALPIRKGTLLLKADYRSASLRRPIREETRKLTSGTAEVTVQVPELREVKASVEFELKDGASVVLSTVDPGFDGEEEHDLLLVLSAELVAKDAEGAK